MGLHNFSYCTPRLKYTPHFVLIDYSETRTVSSQHVYSNAAVHTGVQTMNCERAFSHASANSRCNLERGPY